MIETKDIRIECADGFALAGTIFIPEKLRAGVMIGPATGIRRRFYKSFASFLAENGFGVITFENRGIGESSGDDINAVNASLVNWGRLDMTAVLRMLKVEFPNTTYHVVGHSAGGQLIGLMDNALEIASVFNFASSAGNLKNMDYPFRFKATFFLTYFIPINNLLFGHTNSQWVGMGERLPKAAAAQWGRWCNGAGYVKTDFGKAVKTHLYDDITAPVMWMHAADDGIASTKNVKEMAGVLSKAKSTIQTLRPEDFGFGEIGHMGFFRSKYNQLWKLAIDWLEKFS